MNFAKARLRMVEQQLAPRGIDDARVLAAMRSVAREAFVPDELRDQAFDDRPLAIGFGQTISQPFIVAYMTQALDLTGVERVLEIGTGCGYQTAILAELSGTVFSVEIIPELAERARLTLAALGYRNIRLRCGDGHLGWPEAAPFDRVVVTAAPDSVPDALIEQCATGGRAIIPVGGNDQHLMALDKDAGGMAERRLLRVRFVPMTGGG